MLLFGHTGITLGAALLMRKAVRKDDSSPSRKTSSTLWWHKVLAVFNRLDLRIVIIGSLLPDIIDKPMGIFLLKDTFSNGRIMGHTLLFFAALAVAGVSLKRRTLVPLALAFGTLTHLVFDQMWNSPHTLFWPAYGFAFEKEAVGDWVNNIVDSLLTNPVDYIPELIGVAILTYFIFTLIRQKILWSFLTSGKLE